MHLTLEGFIDSSTGAATVEEVGELFQRLIETVGFSGSAFGRYRAGRVTDFFWDNLPSDFSGTYLEQRWDRIDPLLQRAMRTQGGFHWVCDVNDETLDAPQRDYVAELGARGAKQVVMTVLRGLEGRIDLCGMTTQRADALTDREIHLVHGLAFQAWLCCTAKRPAASEASPPADLSRREFECLQWLRDGKSNWEISQIMRISEKTVEFHVSSVMRKLHAKSRLEAVLIGIRKGMLQV